MPTAQQFLSMAASQLGVGEEPPGSNNVKYNTWYYGHPVSGPDYAWCAVFCLWCADKIGSPNLLNSHSAYVPTLYAEMKANGMAVPSGEPGDIVCFQFDTGLLDHVGIVEKRIGPGTYQTIEGNTGDAVQRHTRSGEMYFCRPKYDSPPPPKTQEDEMSAYQVMNTVSATLIDCYRDRYNYFVTTCGESENVVFTLTPHRVSGQVQGPAVSTDGQHVEGVQDHNLQDVLKQDRMKNIKGSFKLRVTCASPIDISIREVPK
jgi:hypothetical protein